MPFEQRLPFAVRSGRRQRFRRRSLQRAARRAGWSAPRRHALCRPATHRRAASRPRRRAARPPPASRHCPHCRRAPGEDGADASPPAWQTRRQANAHPPARSRCRWKEDRPPELPTRTTTGPSRRRRVDAGFCSSTSSTDCRIATPARSQYGRGIMFDRLYVLNDASELLRWSSSSNASPSNVHRAQRPGAYSWRMARISMNGGQGRISVGSVDRLVRPSTCVHVEASAACRHRMHDAKARPVGGDVAARDRFAGETNDALAGSFDVETEIDDRRRSENGRRSGCGTIVRRWSIRSVRPPARACPSRHRDRETRCRATPRHRRRTHATAGRRAAQASAGRRAAASSRGTGSSVPNNSCSRDTVIGRADDSSRRG